MMINSNLKICYIKRIFTSLTIAILLLVYRMTGVTMKMAKRTAIDLYKSNLELSMDPLAFCLKFRSISGFQS